MNFDDMIGSMIARNDCKVYTEQIEVIKMSKTTFTEILEKMYCTGYEDGAALINKLSTPADWK